MGLSTIIPAGKSELSNGAHECTITDCHILKNEGNPIMYCGSQCLVLAFTSAGKTSEKTFKLGDSADQRLCIKMLSILKMPAESFLNQSIIGKKITVFVQEVRRGTTEIEMRIINFKPAGKKYSFPNSVITDIQ